MEWSEHPRIYRKIKAVYEDLDALSDTMSGYHTLGLLDGFAEFLSNMIGKALN